MRVYEEHSDEELTIIRRWGYRELVASSGDYTQAQVDAMSLGELRSVIKLLEPRMVVERLKRKDGVTVTKTYISKKDE